MCFDVLLGPTVSINSVQELATQIIPNDDDADFEFEDEKPAIQSSQEDVKPAHIERKMRGLRVSPPNVQEPIEILTDDEDDDIFRRKLSQIQYESDVSFLNAMQRQFSGRSSSANRNQPRPAAPSKPPPPAQKPLCDPSPSKRRKLKY